MARYFQGTLVTGPVKASKERTFKEVVETLGMPPKLQIERQAFLSLDKKKRNEIKQVPFFVPAAFRESPSKRSTEHATHANLIFLDIDELPDGRCPAAPFYNNPQLLSEALREFNFAAHVTASSTPQKPRMRIILEADEIPLSEYPKAVATIGALLGLPSITKESSVVVQPMFLPTVFMDDPDEYHPLIAVHLEGRAFTIRDISDSLDSYHGLNGKNGKHTSPIPEPREDALEYLRAPCDDITLAMAREALAATDPDLDYLQWIENAMALRHQFSPHHDDAAFELFDEWSSKGNKYGGVEETKAKWKSARQSPNGRLPVTIRSLLRRAVSHGWNDKRVKESLFTAMTRWAENTPTFMDLVEQGCKRILATPLITSVQEDMLIGTICTQAKRRFGQVVTTTSIRKDLARAKEELKATTDAPKPVKDPLWAKDVVYIIGADEFYRHRTGEKIKPPAFNKAYGRFLMKSKAELKGASLAEQSAPQANPTDYALNHLEINRYQDYAYNPSLPNERWFVHNGIKLINTYNPTYPQADAKNAAKAGKIFMNHMEHLVGEAEYRRKLIDFMAFQVQAPGRKVRYAVMIQSVEGAGKTFLAEVLKAVLGAEHVKTIDGNSIKSGWNEWCFGSQVVVLEEVRVAGSSKHEIMNALKPLITNTSISVNERFRNNREVENISNYMIFSNHHDALALTPGDRRYFVIKSPLQSKQQVLALGENYFPPLYAMLRDLAGALRQWFLDWEISPDFNPDGHAPRTTYVNDMVADSANDLTSTIRRLLLEGDHSLIQYDIVSSGKIKEVIYAEEGMNRTTTQQIAQVLREEGLHQVGRHLVGENREYIWARPGISEEEAVRVATERVKKGMKNLEMQLFF